MSDMETPTYSPRVNRLREKYEQQSEASSLLGGFGQSARAGRIGDNASQTLAQLTRRGGDAEGLDIGDFSGEFDPTDAQAAIGYLTRNNKSNRGNVRWNSRISDRLTELETDRKKQEFNDNILPTYTGAMDRLNELAGTNAISAEQEGLMRSKIAATNRTSAASNLGRVSSALGLRGMADSPAAAALASSVAQDYDIDLQNSLADLGLNVSQANREQARMDSAAAASLATLRINAEQAYLSKDIEAVQSIGRDTAALIDALYSRDKTFELMERQISNAEDQQDKANQMAYAGLILGGVKTAVGAYQGFGGGQPDTTEVPPYQAPSYGGGRMPSSPYDYPNYGGGGMA